MACFFCFCMILSQIHHLQHQLHNVGITTRSATEKILSLGPPRATFRSRSFPSPDSSYLPTRSLGIPVSGTHRIVAPCTEAPVLEVASRRGSFWKSSPRPYVDPHRRNKGFVGVEQINYGYSMV